MMLAMALARFQLITEGTELRLAVNGEPVAGLASVQLIAAPGKVAQLVVQQRGDVLLEGEGVVHVQPEAVGARDLVLAWLDAIDPQQLERDALNTLGWGDETLPEAMVSMLRKLAEQLP